MSKARPYLLITDGKSAVREGGEIVKLEEALKKAREVLYREGCLMNSRDSLKSIGLSSWADRGILVLVVSSFGIVEKVSGRAAPRPPGAAPLYGKRAGTGAGYLPCRLLQRPIAHPLCRQLRGVREVHQRVCDGGQGVRGGLHRGREVAHEPLLPGPPPVGSIWRTSEMASILQTKGGVGAVSSLMQA